MIPKSRVLIGLASVCDYLGVSRPTIYKYLELGMPGARLAGTWHFHVDHIEEFFKRNTFKKEKIGGEDDLNEE